MLGVRTRDWTRDWIEKGIEQGMEQGERIVLSRLLTRRFGPLDEQARQRLLVAGSRELERWADNFLDATSLDEVFGVDELHRQASC